MKQNKLNKSQEKRLDKIIAKAIEHEAIKFADSNITLNALRSGTGGYTGEPFDIGLKKILEPFLSSELSKQKEDILKKLVGEPINCKLCEGICKKYLRNRKKYEDILKEL